MADPLDPDLCALCRQQDCEHTPEEDAEARRRHDAGLAPLVLSGDAPQQQRRAAAAKRGESKADDDLRALMDDERFRRFMWRMMETCGIHRCDPVAAPDGIRAALDEQFVKGMRNIGNLYYLNMERVALPGVAKMIAENGGSK